MSLRECLVIDNPVGTLWTDAACGKDFMRSLLKDQGQAMGATTRGTVLLIHAAQVADCVLTTYRISSVLTISLWNRSYSYLHFTAEETETQSPGLLPSLLVTVLGFEPPRPVSPGRERWPSGLGIFNPLCALEPVGIWESLGTPSWGNFVIM